MWNFTHNRFAAGAGAAILVLALVAVEGDSAEHPRLVSVESTNCTTCHDDLLRGATHIHPPVEDDCTSCHSVDVGELGTTVELLASEPELCLVCHDDKTAAVAGDFEAPHAPVMDSCLNCHQAHAATQDHLLAVAESEVCFVCHEPDDVNAGHELPVSRSRCGSCHKPHGSDTPAMLLGSEIHPPFEDGSCEGCHRRPRGTKIRLSIEGAALCFACHSDLEAEFGKGSVHTPVRDGRCVECHQPHMADEKALLRTSGPELCYSCHRDIKDLVQGSGAHAAAAEDCATCHDPHRSDEAFQLTAAMPDLCLMCHDPDQNLIKIHLGADMATVNCVECHDPHGSSSKSLLASGSVHAPFEDTCAGCHLGSASALVEGGGAALCYACHADLEREVESASVPHAALEIAECIDCHSPHASRQQRLLRSPGGGICLTCHEDQGGGAGQIAHGTVDWFGCQSCHLPHGGSRPKLLREVGNELCLGCHLEENINRTEGGDLELKWGFTVPSHRAGDLRLVVLDPFQNRDHPIRNHPVAGVVEGGGRTRVAKSLIGEEIDCRSCHDPHAGSSRGLFAFEAGSSAELCVACHPR
jgi:predicted CXXCH cytochrome family protein